MGRRAAPIVGAVVLTTAIVAAGATAAVAGASTGASTAGVDTAFERSGAPAVVPFAVPLATTSADGRTRSDCPGSYLSTQQAGAAAPAVRPASAAGP